MIPEGWSKRLLGDLATVQNGYAFKSDDFREEAKDAVAVIRMSNLKEGKVYLSDAKYVAKDVVEGLEKFALHDGDFLFGMSGSLSNYGWISAQNGSCYLNQRVGKLEPRETDKKFVSYLFLSQQVIREIELMAAGAAQLNISGKQIESIDVVAPPLPEQKKIAAILTSVDEAIEKQEAQIAKLQDLKKAMMQELLTQGIGHTEFKDSPVGRIPKGWEVKPLASSDISVLDGDRGKEYPKEKDFMSSGYCLFLSAKNVTKRGFRFRECAFISNEKDSKLRKGRLNRASCKTPQTH